MSWKAKLGVLALFMVLTNFAKAEQLERNIAKTIDSFQREFHFKELEDRLNREQTNLGLATSQIEQIEKRIDWMLGYIALALAIATSLSIFIFTRYNKMYKEAKDELKESKQKFDIIINQAENKHLQLEAFISRAKDNEKELLGIRPEIGKLSSKEVRTLTESFETSKENVNKLELQPIFLQHYQSKALKSIQDKSWFDAILSFQNYISMADDIPETIYFQKGFCETKVEHYNDAIKSFNAALNIDNNHCESLFGLRFIYKKLGRTKDLAKVEEKLHANPCSVDNPFA